MKRHLARLLLAATAFPAIAAAAATANDPGTAEIDRFLAANREFCRTAPSGDCVDRGLAFADTDGDGAISLAETRRLRAFVGNWYAARSESLHRKDQATIGLSIWVADSLGLERVMQLFDSDGDGLVTRAELTADVKLDERPLPEVLADSEAFDRKAMERRLGPYAALFKTIR
ncbi:hypothetical protein [Oceanibacterium hippocampi]|uniref:EF hand n=1 Tax=Oceanibacterium hippocampi TaxID=745714 RepID=A0A1Y5S104_9PROT|nr:hypothetical protein [Oceanibacterium hippocampi]SLN29617.1 EF hand [Oceanibacterium hippocampi]